MITKISDEFKIQEKKGQKEERARQKGKFRR